MRTPALLALALVAFASAAAATPTHAAEFTAEATSDGMPAVRISGFINYGEAKFAVVMARMVRPQSIVLDSPGGSLATALVIARAWHLRTIVPTGATCASACALLWLSGTPRVLLPGGRVGFHEASVVLDGQKADNGWANAIVGGYLSRLGFGDEAITYFTRTPADKIAWLRPEDAARYGIRYETKLPEGAHVFMSKPLSDAGASGPKPAAPPPRNEATGQPIEIRPTAQQSGIKVAMKPQVDPLAGLLSQPIEVRPVHKVVPRSGTQPLSPDTSDD